MASAILLLANPAAYAVTLPSDLSCASLPHVSEEMVKPEYWIKRLPNPGAVILDAEGIARLNREIIRRGFRARPTYEHHRVSGKRTTRILKEQLEGLTHWKKFDRDNKRLRDPAFYNRMALLTEPASVPEKINVVYGLTIGRAWIRLMPTDMLLQRRPDEPQFDILQSSVLDIGQPVALYHLSRDGEWGAVQTAVCFGWIRLTNTAWANGKEQVEAYLGHERLLVALDYSVTVFADSALQIPRAQLNMGSWLPLHDRFPGAYVVEVPERSEPEGLRFNSAYVSISAPVSEGYLELTGEAIIRMAFRQLGNSYGWGGTGAGTDCSQFIVNVFSVFGLELPRTSFLQVKSLSVRSPPDKVSERGHFLSLLPAGRTLLQFPGHIGIYLGSVNGRHYMIHNLAAYRVPGKGQDVEIRTDRVLVSDLSLGQGSRKGSLIENLEKVGVLQ